MKQIWLESDCSSLQELNLNGISPHHIQDWIQVSLVKHPQLFQRYLECQTIQLDSDHVSKLILSKQVLLWIVILSSLFFLLALFGIHYYANHYLDQNRGLFAEQYQWFYRPIPSDFNSEHLRG